MKIWQKIHNHRDQDNCQDKVTFRYHPILIAWCILTCRGLYPNQQSQTLFLGIASTVQFLQIQKLCLLPALAYMKESYECLQYFKEENDCFSLGKGWPASWKWWQLSSTVKGEGGVSCWRAMKDKKERYLREKFWCEKKRPRFWLAEAMLEEHGGVQCPRKGNWRDALGIKTRKWC